MNVALLEKFGRTYDEGDVIFCEYETEGQECFVIHSGEVSIVKISEGVEKTLAILKNGDIFGEMGVLEKKPRTATAIAQTALTVLALDINGLKALVKAQPSFAYKLGKILGNRIVQSYRHLHNLAIDSPKLRVVDMLLWKCIEDGTGPATVNMTPSDIAEFAALDIDEVDQVLKEFATVGRLKIFSDKIELLDVRSLRRLIKPGG